jgi:hypothetical protein
MLRTIFAGIMGAAIALAIVFLLAGLWGCAFGAAEPWGTVSHGWDGGWKGVQSLVFLGAVFPLFFPAVALVGAAVGLAVGAVRRRQPPLETNPTKRPPPSVVKCLLWAFLWLAMWFWAIAGSLIVVCTAVSFFVDISAVVSMGDSSGEPVRTTEQKIQFLVFGALLGFLGIGFLLLCRWGYLKGPL